jgi:hypothetical protein
MTADVVSEIAVVVVAREEEGADAMPPAISDGARDGEQRGRGGDISGRSSSSSVVRGLRESVVVVVVVVATNNACGRRFPRGGGGGEHPLQRRHTIRRGVIVAGWRCHTVRVFLGSI